MNATEQCICARRHERDDLLKFKLSNRVEILKKKEKSDVDHLMVFGVRWSGWSIPEIADYWKFPTQTYLGFKEDVTKTLMSEDRKVT